MKVRKYLIAFILLILCIPMVSKADTWLDDPSYRDTSWFDAETYDSATEYTIDTRQKMAGLLYLVNEENYTFEDKYIYIKGQSYGYNGAINCYNTRCVISMDEHDWVPLKSTFKGSFITKERGRSYYVVLLNNTEKIDFSEDYLKACTINSNNSLSCYTTTTIATYVSKISVNEVSHATVNVPNYGSPTGNSGIIEFEIYPDEGYYLDDIKITYGNYQGNARYVVLGDNKYGFYMPDVPVNIEIIIKEKDNVSCMVVSGNGKNIGDEIACGTEHFYVVSNDNNNIKMLAKYNLYTGISIYREKIEVEINSQDEYYQYCSNLAQQHNGLMKYDGFYNTPGYCFYTVNLPTYKMIQTEDSKSAHWDNDLNYLYPQVGDVYIKYDSNVPYSSTQIEDTNFYDYPLNFDNLYSSIGDMWNSPATGVSLPLDLYSKRLKNYGVDVVDISLLSLTELNELTNEISGSKIPLKSWGENVEVTQSSSNGGHDYATEVHFGDLKPYIPDKYKWLYSTTYWNGSLFKTSSPETYGNAYYVFTAEQGKLCGAGFQYCAPTTTLGCGIRPVVTIPADSLIYEIKTETDDYSDIEVVSTSPAEEEITFRLSINQGRKLRSLTIRTDNNEEVTFTEGELINNPDGTISINSNKFTMPFSNVTIIVNTDPYLKAEVIKKDNCEITLTKADGLEAGENVIVTVTCNDGYEFKSLEVKDENNNTVSYISFRNTYSFNMPTSNVTIGGECSLITYSAEVIKEENGNVTLSKETEITPNEEVTATIECNEGYEFDSLEVIDKNDNKVTLTDNKFSMPASNVKVSGICKKVEEEPVTPDEPVVPSETDTNTPITSDNIIIYVVLLIISIISLVLVTKKLLTKKK